MFLPPNAIPASNGADVAPRHHRFHGPRPTAKARVEAHKAFSARRRCPGHTTRSSSRIFRRFPHTPGSSLRTPESSGGAAGPSVQAGKGSGQAAAGCQHTLFPRRAAAGKPLSTLQPDITASLSGNAVQLGWGWGSHSAFPDMCEFHVDRGAGWVALVHDTTPNYTDTTPLPATPAKCANYRVGDAQVGLWSNTVEVVVGG